MSGDRLPQFQQHPAGPEPPASTASQYGTYKVREEPLGSTKPIRIVLIGAGASGLNMIRTLRLGLTSYELVVYEKNEDIGGTWFENRYPGCRCDVPSHNYQFSWRPNHEWSNFFSPAKEIQEYLCKICDEEGMRDTIKTSHRVSSARWNEEKGIWNITVRNTKTNEEFDDYATFLLDGTGILNNWTWPDVPGLQDFQGTLIHTACWPEDFDHRGKVVAVIGNGSTGVQLVPEIQPGAEKLYHIVRTPTWVIPPRRQAMLVMGNAKDILSEIELDEKENFSQATIARFKSDPDFYRRFVKGIEREVNNGFPVILKDGPVQAFARAKVVEYMTAMLGGDEVLCKKLIPTFALGCRRLTPAPGYLQSLVQPNVSVITEGMKRIVPEGIELHSGEVLKVDAIICATGFNLSFCPRFPLVGRKGNLQESWRQEVPKAYMSCAVAGLPNYFTFLGPNGPIGHGSVFTLTEHIAKYICGIIKKCQTEGIKSIVPSQAAVDDYFEHITTFMPRTAWASSCRSWFKGGKEDGPVVALHPGSRIHFFHMLERFRGEDWEYVYDNDRQNRFEYLGNGFSTKELDPSVDSTWYLDAPATSRL
ncbi:FAD/NAD(P)-binding domain-containing protein [Coniochaeta ligniaria NRRL 30616]|uniref:FAD/NAD(P)-binding domain-containing protein n=1 Tax=Coniochaeta ligniaria NRRL 30616 TaxID=1408157 RepID=A0A1J7JPK2_9PEZI|nr:FAD/NAD(P)-binding domain-containing protein [Coniochaeta ligniaria NRRL 30616]